MAHDCIFEILATYDKLKKTDLTKPQLQRTMIDAYNFLVVGYATHV